MTNLSTLVQNGLHLAEPAQENMTSQEISAILAFAIQEAKEELLDEALEENGVPVDDSDDSKTETFEQSLLEGTLPNDLPILEVSIVRLDKKAKKQRSYKLAILQCAKDDDNQDYKRLETIWRMEKFLFRKLEKKYKTRAKQRMKQTAAKASGNSPVVKRAKSNLTKSQRETAKALAGDTKPPSKIKSQFKSVTTKLASKI